MIIGVHAPEFAFERDRQCPQGGRRPRHPLSRSRSTTTTRLERAQQQLLAGALLLRCPRPASYHHHRRGGVRPVGARDPPAARRGRSCAGRCDDRTSRRRAPKAAASGGSGRRKPTSAIYRAERFASPGGLLHDAAKTYSAAPLTLNQWDLQGRWIDQRQSARSLAAGAKIDFRFRSRDLHLVLGSATGKPVRFRVLLDGKPSGADAGMDVGRMGRGRSRGRGSTSWSAEGADAGSDVHHRIPRPGCRGFLVHLRLSANGSGISRTCLRRGGH